MVANEEQTEGQVAKSIEQRTVELPSDTFLWAAGGSILVSLALRMSGQRDNSIFVGQWAPTFLLLGLYNKLVKLEGSESTDKRGSRSDRRQRDYVEA
jgi:hypothetical protein